MCTFKGALCARSRARYERGWGGVVHAFEGVSRVKWLRRKYQIERRAQAATGAKSGGEA